MTYRTAIIEDHTEFRNGICLMLKTTEGFECTGSFGSVEEALEKLNDCDIILLDINLPGISGLHGIEKLKHKIPECKIIILTVYDDAQNVFRAILEGADGYILKKTPPQRLLQAIEEVMEGGAPMTPVIARQALNLFKKYVPKSSSHDLLSARESEILKYLVEGLSNDEISSKLFISIQTVRNHIRHIYEKLHVHSKSQAVAKALKEGFFTSQL